MTTALENSQQLLDEIRNQFQKENMLRCEYLGMFLGVASVADLMGGEKTVQRIVEIAAEYNNKKLELEAAR